MKMLEVTFRREREYGKCSDKGIHLLRPDQRALDDALEKINREDGAWSAVFIYCDKWADLKAWKRPDSYMGHQYWGYVGLCGQSRDSDTVERSNFERIQEDAEKECGSREYNWLEEAMPVIETAHASHWAVGWVETLMVYWADVKALDFAASVRKALEGYPVYDDEHHSELAYEESEETYDNNADTFKGEVAKYLTGSDETDGFDPKQLDDVTHTLYRVDCGYGGEENAWVSLDEIPNLVRHGQWELTRAARDGNKIARQLMLKAGVKMPRKSRRKVVNHV